MDYAIVKLIGKRISGVIVKQGRHPASQVFLIFDDGTHYELYADSEIYGVKDIYQGGGESVRACPHANRIILDYCI